MDYKAWDGNCTWNFKPTRTCPVKLTTHFWPKTNSFRADLAQIACTHSCRLLHKHSKVNTGSSERSTKLGIGIAHGFSIQTHHLPPSWPPNLAKNDQFQGYSGPNNMCKWLHRAAEAFQSQNRFTSKDHDNWDGNRTWNFKSISTFSAKLTPNFGQKRAAPGLIWPKWHVQMVVDCCRSIPKSKSVHEQGL